MRHIAKDGTAVNISERVERREGGWHGYIVIRSGNCNYRQNCGSIRLTKADALHDALQERMWVMGQVGA